MVHFVAHNPDGGVNGTDLRPEYVEEQVTDDLIDLTAGVYDPRNPIFLATVQKSTSTQIQTGTYDDGNQFGEEYDEEYEIHDVLWVNPSDPKVIYEDEPPFFESDDEEDEEEEEETMPDMTDDEEGCMDEGQVQPKAEKRRIDSGAERPRSAARTSGAKGPRREAYVTMSSGSEEEEEESKADERYFARGAKDERVPMYKKLF